MGRNIRYLLFIWLTLTAQVILAGGESNAFIHFNNENGQLTNNIVEAVVRDSFGYVWVGTNNGLNRLDGYKTSNYLFDQKNPNSISSNFIKSLFIDNDGDLWIGTIGGGVNLYDRKNDCFIRFYSDDASKRKIDGINISTILQDKNGFIWIGTNGDGISRYDKKTATVKRYQLDPNDLFNTNIRTLLCDASNNIWVGFDYESSGIYKIDSKTDKISFYRPAENNGISTNIGPVRGIVEQPNGTIVIAAWNGNLYSVSNRNNNTLNLIRNEHFHQMTSITNIVVDKIGNIWVGTWEQGIYVLSPEFRIIKKFEKDKTLSTSITSNAINGLYIDPQNNLWVAYRNSGISLLSLKRQMFGSLLFNLHNEPYLGEFDTQKIIKDKHGNLWFATRGQGLWSYNPISKITKQYVSDKLNGLSSNFLLTLFLGSDNKIWIGTDGKFILSFDPDTEKFTQVTYDWGEWSAAFCIAESQHYLWVGTWGGGLKRVDKISLDVKTFDFDPTDQYQNSIFDLKIIDSTLWIANVGLGLFKMNLNNNRLESVFPSQSDTLSVAKIRINDIYVENDSILWLSTAGNGSFRFNTHNGNYRIFNKTNGLSVDIVQSVIADKYKNYWFATQLGVTVLQNQFQDHVNFYTHNGLLNNAINKSSLFYDDQNDCIYVGTPLGVNYFYPNQTIIDSLVNNVVFTSLNVMGNDIKSGSNSYFNGSLDIAKEIILYPKDKVFTISFSAMDFTPSFLNSYNYKLENFDEDWTTTPYGRNFAQYTNLDPGEYIFKVKTINHDGIKANNYSSIRIIIKPAFYQTFLFKISIVALLISCIYLFFRIRYRNLQLAKIKLEENVKIRTQEIEKQRIQIEKQNKQLEESNASKDRFFSIIGHDLSNPMSSIDQLLELLEMDYETMSPESILILIKHLRKSSDHTLTLLKNLMTWAQTQTNRIKIEKQPVKIIDLLDGVKHECELLALQKGQHLQLSVNDADVGFFDKNTISTVLRNLVTNAIKFSQPEKTIVIKAVVFNQKIILSVKDHGVGMNELEVNNLFKIETIKSKKGTLGETGTGLGLILCYEFVSLNDGEIWVESQKGKGTTFFFSLDLYKNQP